MATTSQPASVDALEGLYVHLEQAMVAIGYLDPEEPKRLMARLRRLFNRARLTQTELDVLRGISCRHHRIAQRARRTQENSLATIVRCLPSYAKTSIAFCSETRRRVRAGKC